MRNWAIGLGCLILSSMAPLYGQSASTGILEGKVTDESGAPVAQADILVSHQDGVTRRAASSDARGAFRIGFLPPGLYRLTIRRIGFQPVQINELSVRPGRVEQVAITLERAAVRLDSIVVQAAPVRINTSDTESGSRLTTKDLAVLPIPNDVHSLVAFTPGARPDQIWGAANAQANNYQLDGVSINHPGIGGDLLPPAPSWIQEIEVRGLGAGAEYGNFQGGLVNIVTRSGTDRHEGELRTNGETWRLNGTNLRVAGGVYRDRSSDLGERLARPGLPFPVRRNPFAGTPSDRSDRG